MTAEVRTITEEHGITRTMTDAHINRGNLSIDSLLLSATDAATWAMKLTTEDKLMLMRCQLQLQKNQVENTILIAKAKLRQREREDINKKLYLHH